MPTLSSRRSIICFSGVPHWPVLGVPRGIGSKRSTSSKPAFAVTRPVRLRVSFVVQEPTVVDWLRPILLVPAAALSRLSTAQLEALLIHELTRIRPRLLGQHPTPRRGRGPALLPPRRLVDLLATSVPNPSWRCDDEGPRGADAAELAAAHRARRPAHRLDRGVGKLDYLIPFTIRSAFYLTR